MQKSNIETNDRIIHENDIEIENITNDMKCIHEMYTDLALLINEQSVHINTIADNIEQCANQTDFAIMQLQITEKHTIKKCNLL